MFKNQASITVWRGMTVDREWARSLEAWPPVGSCWAWSEEGAVKGAGLERTGEDGILMRARIDPQDVDWETTIAVNTFHEDEREIVVMEGVTLNLEQIASWKSRQILLESPGLDVVAGDEPEEAEPKPSRGPCP